MRSVSEQIQKFSRGQIQRVASNMPGQCCDAPPVEQVAHVINGVFTQLLAVFPASLANRDQREINEIRRQWVMAFRENGITSLDQVSAGMRIARKQERPFLPSPGQFIAWCRSGEFSSAGLPSPDELYDMMMKFCSERSMYDSAEEYPWPSNAAYWMVTKLRDQMRSLNLSESEVRARCGVEIRKMAERIKAGEEIPAPVKQIPKLCIPVSNDVGLSKISEIRNKYFKR